MKKLMNSIVVIVLAASLLLSITSLALAETVYPEMYLQLGHVNPTTERDQYHKFATEFARLVSDATKGAVVIDILGNSELGGENDLLSGLQFGTLPLAIITNGTYGNINGSSKLLEMPFIFADKEIAYNFIDGNIVKEVENSLYNIHGFKVLGWGEGGFRNILSNGKIIRTPEDLKGFKIRIPEFETFVKTFQKLGANPTPMAFAEVYTAVQQGVIEGLELPVASTFTGKYQEICSSYSLTGHFYNAITISVSRAFWDGLSPELQQVFKSSAEEAGRIERAWLTEQEEIMLSEINEAGCEVIRDVDKAAFSDAVKDIYINYRDTIGADLFDRAMDELGK